MERSNIQTIVKSAQSERDIHFMQIALQYAKLAAENNEVPVGAILVWNNNEIIATAYNNVEENNNATQHAEIVCLNKAIQKMGMKYLTEATMYVTLEPCSMCAGALVLTKIKRLVYGASDPKAGAVSSLYSITNDQRLNHRIEVTSGVMEAECSIILKEFFNKLRKK